MGTLVSSTLDDAALGGKRSEARRRSHVPQHAASPGRRAPAGRDRGDRGGIVTRAVATVWRYLPRGNTLDDETFQRRHLFLCWVLALHVPGLFALGVWRGYDPWHVGLEMVVPLACVLFGRLALNRRLAAFFITAGLVYCSTVLVHLSGGSIEAHFHFFILIGLIALYQDWVPFLWNVIFTVLSHGLGTVIAPDLIFTHAAGQARPWTWAAIHGVSVLAACVGVIIFWKHTEQEQERNVQLVADLAAADARRREAMSELLVNLARRNQSLLNRQLEVITDLELREQQAEVLEELFRLDHLATRIRRNAESLLVLSGDDPARRWGTPVPLGDVARAAAAEVEDYRRVEVLVNDHIEVAGRAVADLAHLLAELIENATTFSPPSTEVRVRSQLSSGDLHSTVISIEDQGIGMPEDELRAANTLLADPPEVDLGRSTMLGFHVVARLAQRYGLAVRLAATPGGGVTAMVALPQDLVSERRAAAPASVVGAGTGDGAYAGGGAWPGSEAGGRLARLNAFTFNGNGERPAVHEPAPAAWHDGAGAPPDEPVPWRDPAPWRRPAPALPEALPFTPAAPPGPPAPTPAPRPAPIPALAPAPPIEERPITPPDWWFESEAFLRPSNDGAAPDPQPAQALATDTPLTAPPAGKTSVWPLSGSPAGTASAPVAAESVLPPLADGLVRRVPGTHLAPSLRRDGAGEAGSAPAPARDREQVRSALSKFQANQRAARAAAEAPPADPSEENR